MKYLTAFLCIASLTFLNFLHADISYEINAENNFKKEGEKLAKKYDLKLIGSGLGKNIVGGTDARWALSFTSEKELTLEEVRPLAADISFHLLYVLYHDRVYAQYYKHSQQERAWAKETLNDNEVGFRLAFWDKKVDRPLYPYLAQVRLADGKIYYHYANPKTQALEPPIIESLDSLDIPNYK